MPETHEHAVKRGKTSRKAGTEFERKVRANLEKQGWIVCKWSNNIDMGFRPNEPSVVTHRPAKLIPAKHTYNPFRRSMTAGHGFPDFIAFKPLMEKTTIQLVESKMTGKLDREEKDKIEWIIQNLGIPVIIASKGEKRGQIIYTEFQLKKQEVKT